MRVCVLTTSYPRFAEDEAGIFVKRLVEGYHECGVSGMVIVPRDCDEVRKEADFGFAVRRVAYRVFAKRGLAFGAGMMPNLRRNPALILQAPILVLRLAGVLLWSRKQYDCVHANWILAACIAWVSSLFTRKPYIVTLRGEDVRLLRNWWARLVCWWVIRGAAAITSVNREFADEISKRFARAPENTHFVANGVAVASVTDEELATFIADKHLCPSSVYLLNVGTVIPRKGVHTIIEALAADELSHVRLIVCGRLADDRHYQELQGLIAKHHLGERVHFQGKVAPHEIPYYLGLATAYLTASDFEGRPNAVLEACAAGVPVIASKISAHSDFLEHEYSALLFDISEQKDLVRCIKRICKDEALRQKLIAAGKELVADLSWKRCAGRYVEIMPHEHRFSTE